jgi:hypothetical protein
MAHTTVTQWYAIPMAYTLAAAASATGTNKTTILRAIKSHKISATKDEHGVWRVEPVELHRVYPPVTRSDAPADATQRYATGENTSDDAIRAALAESRLSDLKAALEDMRGERDRWRAMAERLAITDQRPALRRSWWPWRRTG